MAVKFYFLKTHKIMQMCIITGNSLFPLGEGGRGIDVER